MNRHTQSGQSRVFRVTQLRTDGVHYRESAGTEPVNLKVVPNECCLGRSPWTNWYKLMGGDIGKFNKGQRGNYTSTLIIMQQ